MKLNDTVYTLSGQKVLIVAEAPMRGQRAFLVEFENKERSWLYGVALTTANPNIAEEIEKVELTPQYQISYVANKDGLPRTYRAVVVGRNDSHLAIFDMDGAQWRTLIKDNIKSITKL